MIDPRPPLNPRRPLIVRLALALIYAGYGPGFLAFAFLGLILLARCVGCGSRGHTLGQATLLSQDRWHGTTC